VHIVPYSITLANDDRLTFFDRRFDEVWVAKGAEEARSFTIWECRQRSMTYI